jgi:hypothetical protein
MARKETIQHLLHELDNPCCYGAGYRKTLKRLRTLRVYLFLNSEALESILSTFDIQRGMFVCLENKKILSYFNLITQDFTITDLLVSVEKEILLVPQVLRQQIL